MLTQLMRPLPSMAICVAWEAKLPTAPVAVADKKLAVVVEIAPLFTAAPNEPLILPPTYEPTAAPAPAAATLLQLKPFCWPVMMPICAFAYLVLD